MKKILTIGLATILLLVGCSASVQKIGSDSLGYFNINTEMKEQPMDEGILYYSDVNDENKYSKFITATYFDLTEYSDAFDTIKDSALDYVEVAMEDTYLQNATDPYDIEEENDIELDGITGKVFKINIKDGLGFYGYLILLYGEKDDSNSLVMREYYMEAEATEAESIFKEFESSFSFNK